MRKLLVQLDTDRLPSAFDRIVASDAGADDVLSYGGVTESDVQAIVHGAIFTRGPKDLKKTALFIGGSSLPAAERLLAAARSAFFGPFRVSILFDPNGCNTTAAAAVVKLVKAIGGDVAKKRALVLAGTGPVGTRAAGLLLRQGADVAITSRDEAHGTAAAEQVGGRFKGHVDHVAVRRPAEARDAIGRAAVPELRAVADVNAVPPLGIEGVEATDNGETREGVPAFGALGVGGLKMKTHRAAVARLFEQSDLVLDAEEIYDLAAGL
jgi:methylenetetrahydrofolate/methylenetetrahydromethanopterin dehydrogenase (NADP+)